MPGVPSIFWTLAVVRLAGLDPQEPRDFRRRIAPINAQVNRSPCYRTCPATLSPSVITVPELPGASETMRIRKAPGSLIRRQACRRTDRRHRGPRRDLPTSPRPSDGALSGSPQEVGNVGGLPLSRFGHGRFLLALTASGRWQPASGPPRRVEK